MQTVSRLMKKFFPEAYQLSLDLDRTGRLFSGIVTINGIAPKNQDSIVVHAKDLSIESVIFDGKRAEFTHNKDELTIKHPDIIAGKHVVVIAFSGAITDAMHGLYPCYYDHDGTKKELLATQFESHHAREVFPCIDEPEAKATFDVTLATEENITVLGNMPVKHQSVESSRLVTVFETTPRMSTYLLAWVTGELQCKKASTKDGVEVGIWATLAQPAESLDFALEHAVKTTEFFNDYFGVSYPLPKSDHVALPDFSSGAMENWGLITYRETTLLAHPTQSAISSKQYVASVIAHELSHQWFGNLVTMKWWNNLWLNESFATLMSYIAVDALHPEWNSWLDFSTQEGISAFRRDSIDGVQPVQTEVRHPDEISTLFDGAIVYAKGARLLRMLQHYLGDDTFRTGLRRYFEQHAYGNTEEHDLWQAFDRVSGKAIGVFMEPWISQPGFPIVSVDKGLDTIQLHQQQFFVGPHQSSKRTWPIPLTASVAELPELLTDRDQKINLDTTTFRLNVGDVAHFITRYDVELLAAITNELQNLPPVERLRLLHEQMMLARSEFLSSGALIPLLNAYKNETDESVWSIIALSISELKKFVEHDKKSEKQLKALAINLAHQQYQRLGWEARQNEPEVDIKLRPIVVGLMLYGEEPKTIRTALDLYNSTAVDNLNPELRSLVISAAVRFGNDESIVQTLIDHYKTTPLGNLKQDIVAGLTSSRDTIILQQVLSLIKDDSIVRHQDVLKWFIGIIRNRDGRALAWQWLQDNWTWITKTFGNDKSLDYFPRFAANSLMSRKQLDEYRAFFMPMQAMPLLARTIGMGLLEIEGRVELIERDKESVAQNLAEL